MAMTPEQRETIMPAMKLQGDIRVRLQEMGFGNRAGDVAGEIMHLVLTSDAVRPEIAEVYSEVDDGSQ